MLNPHILKQIWSERSRNGWIFAELLIVFCLTWYLVDYAFVMVHNRMIPSGFDVRDTYYVGYSKKVNETNRVAFDAFAHRVTTFPGVQTSFVTSQDDLTPYAGSYSGSSISANDSTGVVVGAQIRHISSNDYFRIFGIRSAISGDVPKVDFSNLNQVVLTSNVAKALFGEVNAIGKIVWSDNQSFRVADVIVDQKRYEYTLPNGMAYFLIAEEPIEDEYITPSISIKVGKDFDIERFKKEVSEGIKPYSALNQQIEDAMGVSQEQTLRNAIMYFFFFNIALGVIGTFWFRNQSRRSEIGIRMALGSGHRGILRYYLGEALWILTLAAVPAIIINVVLLDAGLITTPGDSEIAEVYITSNKWLRFAITNAITYVILGSIVTLSAWIPAYRASKINPVEALKDE